MSGFGVSVVAELCEALGDLIEAAPRVAQATAKRIGAQLRRRVELQDEHDSRELDLRAQRAAKGLPEFG